MVKQWAALSDSVTVGDVITETRTQHAAPTPGDPYTNTGADRDQEWGVGAGGRNIRILNGKYE